MARQPLVPPKSAAEMLEMTFLEIRSHLLEAAAGLDRIERSAQGPAAWGVLTQDPRLQRLLKALPILEQPGADRAERLLTLLSDL